MREDATRRTSAPAHSSDLAALETLFRQTDAAPIPDQEESINRSRVIRAAGKLSWEHTVYCDGHGGEYPAVRIRWSDVEELLGESHAGGPEQDEELVTGLLNAGAPHWVKDAPGWIDELGWGLYCRQVLRFRIHIPGQPDQQFRETCPKAVEAFEEALWEARLLRDDECLTTADLGFADGLLEVHLMEDGFLRYGDAYIELRADSRGGLDNDRVAQFPPALENKTEAIAWQR